LRFAWSWNQLIADDAELTMDPHPSSDTLGAILVRYKSRMKSAA